MLTIKPDNLSHKMLQNGTDNDIENQAIGYETLELCKQTLTDICTGSYSRYNTEMVMESIGYYDDDMMDMIIKHPHMHCHITTLPEKYVTPDVLRKIIISQPRSAVYFKQEWLSQELCDLAINKDVTAYKYFSMHHFTKNTTDYVLMNVDLNCNIVSFLLAEQGEDTILRNIRKRPDLIKILGYDNQTDAVIKTALMIDGTLLRHVVRKYDQEYIDIALRNVSSQICVEMAGDIYRRWHAQRKMLFHIISKKGMIFLAFDEVIPDVRALITNIYFCLVLSSQGTYFNEDDDVPDLVPRDPNDDINDN